jgi:hypothetical protein
MDIYAIQKEKLNQETVHLVLPSGLTLLAFKTLTMRLF